MCTLVALFRVHPEIPLILAANRDEFYSREATVPGVLHEEPKVIAGKDLCSGGTWLGASTRGFFVGLTNQRQWAMVSGASKSRGPVVAEALAQPSIAAVRGYLDTLNPAAFGEFNLLYGDASQLFVAYSRQDATAIEHHQLEPGVTILANDRLGSAYFPKVKRAHELVAPHVAKPWAELREFLETMLADAEMPALDEILEPPPHARIDRQMAQRLQALCIRTPVYGTVSATILAIGEAGVLEHRFAAGAPDDTEFQDYTSLYH